MRTNPGANINTNWQINGIVKPAHVNALTKGIQYDYVVPAERVTQKNSLSDDPDDLYALCGMPPVADCDVSILINSTLGIDARTDVGDQEDIHGPLFKIKASEFVTEGHSVHIYALCAGQLGGYCLKVEGAVRCGVYLHTSGEIGAVSFLSGSVRSYESGIWIGSAYDMNNIDNSTPRGRITYETSVDGKIAQGDVIREPWMSNSVGGAGGSRAIAVLLNYSRIGRSTVPSTEFPLCIRWKGKFTDTTGVITANSIFPEGTPVGKYIDGCLVPRDKPAYNGQLLPSLFSGSLVEFRSKDGTWKANETWNEDPVTGFVLNDSFFGCYTVTGHEYPCDGVRVTSRTTQLDVYTSFGLVFADTGVVVPTDVPKLLHMDITDMEEGQAIELNIHIVEFPPARQALNAMLGGEHFIGEWDSTVEYDIGDLVTITHTNGQGDKSYTGYRALIHNDGVRVNIGVDPELYPDWWEKITFFNDIDLKAGAFHAATPFNSGVEGSLKFITDANPGGVPIVSWGYGTPPSVTGGASTGTNPVMRVTFTNQHDWKNTHSPDHGIMPTIPIAASAKIIFTKTIFDGALSVLVLTGGYCCPKYPESYDTDPWDT